MTATIDTPRVETHGTRELPAETGLESFTYDDKVVRAFLMFTYIWGVVAFLVGIYVAVELVWPAVSLGLNSCHTRYPSASDKWVLFGFRSLSICWLSSL